MSALHQEAISILNTLPEQYVSLLINQMKEYAQEAAESDEEKKERSRETHGNIIEIYKKRRAAERAKADEEKSRCSMPVTQEQWDAFMARQEIDQKKAAAFERLQKLVEKNRGLYDEYFDYDQARWEALNEKYGPFN